MTLNQIPSSHVDWSKNMATRGRGVLPYMAIDSENLKNLLLLNYLADFQIFLQKCSLGDTLQYSFKPWWLVKKHGHQGAGLFGDFILPYGRGAILALLGLLFI